jgi:hypothetical protein
MIRLRTSHVFVAAVAASTAILAGACGQGNRPTSGASPTSAPTASAPTAGASGPVTAWALPSGWRLCTNDYERYEIGYPGSWYTTSLRPEEVCSQFHPSAFTIPPYSEYPLTALNIHQTSGAFPADLGKPVDSEFAHTLLWEETTVGGRRAVRFEEEFIGSGLYSKGTRRYGYTIDRQGQTVTVFAMASPGENDYAAWKVVVDRAAETVRFL